MGERERASRRCISIHIARRLGQRIVIRHRAITYRPAPTCPYKRQARPRGRMSQMRSFYTEAGALQHAHFRSAPQCHLLGVTIRRTMARSAVELQPIYAIASFGGVGVGIWSRIMECLRLLVMPPSNDRPWQARMLTRMRYNNCLSALNFLDQNLGLEVRRDRSRAIVLQYVAAE